MEGYAFQKLNVKLAVTADLNFLKISCDICIQSISRNVV